MFAGDFTLITQNVDGLHRAAGSSNVIEIHGNIMRSKCSRDQQVVDEAMSLEGDLPRCPDCGSLLRPYVVWFGESLPSEAFAKALEASLSCDVFMSIGTSGVVQPAASFALEARRAGAITAEFNIEDTPMTRYFDFALRDSAASLLPRVVERVQR